MQNNRAINIYLVRHGEANASWDEDRDPGLSAKGKKQATAVAEELFSELPKVSTVISSPLARAIQTAEPLINKINVNLVKDKIFSEIPSPGISLSKRKQWLRNIFNIDIMRLGKPQQEWKKDIIQSVSEIERDTIIFSHFMVINCIIGWITKSKKLVNFYPDNCSIVKLSKKGKEFTLVEKGKELTTTVQ